MGEKGRIWERSGNRENLAKKWEISVVSLARILKSRIEKAAACRCEKTGLLGGGVH
jgi:hypothetical protein